MQKITIYDFTLLPVYIAIFYYFVKRKAASYDIETAKFFMNAFYLRMFGCIAYCLVVQYYYGYGDSFTYYEGSDFFHEQLSKNVGNIKYYFVSSQDLRQWFTMESDDANLAGFIEIPSAAAVMKISGLLSFLSFNKFMIISLFFALFSFAGQWKLFQVFNDYNGCKNQKLLAYAVLYSPSIWFWGSGLMKDSLCIGAAGFIIYILYRIFAKKEISLKGIIALPFLIYMVFIVKSYIILILLASFAAVVFVRYILQLRNIILRLAAITIFLVAVVFVLSVYDFSGQINSLVEESYAQVQSYQQNYQIIQNQDENSKAAYDLGNFDPSLSSMILKSPNVIFSCLYRPFIWESKKIIILFTALESSLLLLAMLYLLIKTKFVGFFVIVFSNPLILFSVVASILFALVIGFTTFNFGTMIRYKIILLPFYYFMLVAIYNRSTPKDKALLVTE